MTDKELNVQVAERVMGLDLKPHRDVALVKIGWDNLGKNGPIATLRDGRCIEMPPGNSLRSPVESKNFNDRYALHVAEFLGDEIVDQVDAYRLDPDPYCTDMNKAWEVVEKMKDLGFSFSMTAVPMFSSVQSGVVAGFTRGVHPPTGAGPGSYYGNRSRAAEAICRAALLAIAASKER